MKCPFSSRYQQPKYSYQMSDILSTGHFDLNWIKFGQLRPRDPVCPSVDFLHLCHLHMAMFFKNKPRRSNKDLWYNLSRRRIQTEGGSSVLKKWGLRLTFSFWFYSFSITRATWLPQRVQIPLKISIPLQTNGCLRRWVPGRSLIYWYISDSACFGTSFTHFSQASNTPF